MLHEFITTQRDPIIARARERLSGRPWLMASTDELEHGVPLFLTQLSETLRWELTATPFSPTAIGSSATRHGGELRTLGLNVSQVVHAYGDICQSVTELALEQQAPITTEEFRTLNRCLDVAIAEAVTEHARMTAKQRSTEELERLGQVAHEVRDILNTALLAFEALKRGNVAINGSTGAVLGRSLMGLRDLVDTTLSDVRMSADAQRRERMPITAFINDVALAAGLHAADRDIRFVVECADAGLAVTADPQLLASALMNLLNNAFKYTPTGGLVVLRAHRAGEHLVIEVDDECGGIPDSQRELFQPFDDQRGTDRTGLGLGLSIARKAIRAQDGEIRVHNRPGEGCTFAIDLPLAAAGEPERMAAI